MHVKHAFQAKLTQKHFSKISKFIMIFRRIRYEKEET